MAAYPDGEDWRGAILSIDTSRLEITGQFLPRVGPRRPVTVELNGQGATITITDLPAPRCESVSILVDKVEYRNSRPSQMFGRLSGRCPDTLDHHVILTRIP